MLKKEQILLLSLLFIFFGCTHKTVPNKSFYNSNIKIIDVYCGALDQNESQEPTIKKFEESIIKVLNKKGYVANPINDEFKNYTLMSSYIRDHKTKMNCDAIVNVLMDIELSKKEVLNADQSNSEIYTVNALKVTYGCVNRNGDSVLGASVKFSDKIQRKIDSYQIPRPKANGSIGTIDNPITGFYIYSETEEQYLERVATLLLDNFPRNN